MSFDEATVEVRETETSESESMPTETHEELMSEGVVSHHEEEPEPDDSLLSSPRIQAPPMPT